jgi:peptidoglycan/LPS O-acetylase OafA/YrhL
MGPATILRAMMVTADTAAEPAVAPPPGNPRFPLFDALRAIAALSVVVYHTAFYARADQASSVGALLARLNIGVAIFFVISGFLIYRPFAAARMEGRSAPRLIDYARRRFLRIVPAYWVALTLLAIWPGLNGMWDDAPIFYAFGQVYSSEHVLQGISPAWTLSTEIAFYAALPLYAWIASRARIGLRAELIGLAALAGASLAVRTIAVGADMGTLGLTLPGTFAWFAAGMALAAVSAAAVDPPAWLKNAGLAWGAAAVLYVILAYTLGRPEGFLFAGTQQGYGAALFEFAMSGAIAALVVVPAAFGSGGPVRSVLGARTLAWLGLVSYGIYLWHHNTILWLIDQDVLERFDAAPFLALTVLSIAIVVPIAAASYYLVERPALRFKNGIPRRAGRAAGPRPGAVRGEESGPAGP